MSFTGLPKEKEAVRLPRQIEEAGGLAVKSTVDVCKGCRKCCQSMIKTVANNRGLTYGCIALPMLVMMFFLIYLETFVESFVEEKLIPYQIQIFRQYKLTLFSPMYILASITFGFGLFAMIAIRCEFQNLLRFSAFVYRGIAHWILLSIFLLTGPIAGYLPLYMIFQITCWSLFPSLLWLFTAGVMTGHSDLITHAIESRALAVHQINQDFQAV